MISRRGFLLGGLGVATAGIGGTGLAATTRRGRRALHAVGLHDRAGVVARRRRDGAGAFDGPLDFKAHDVFTVPRCRTWRRMAP